MKESKRYTVQLDVVAFTELQLLKQMSSDKLSYGVILQFLIMKYGRIFILNYVHQLNNPSEIKSLRDFETINCVEPLESKILEVPNESVHPDFEAWFKREGGT
jgi:hypothetical protein